MNKIIKRFILISEGQRLKDKLKIFLSVITLNKYSSNLNLKNNDGIFSIRKKSADLWMLSTLGERELRKYFFLKRGVFLDVGANVGKYSIIMGRKMGKKGKVYAFEPEPHNLIALERNIKLNNLQNIRIVPLACSDKKSIIEFYIDEKNTGGHSMIRKTNKKIKVKTERIDEIISSEKIRNVGLVKIDAEGAEMKVL